MLLADVATLFEWNPIRGERTMMWPRAPASSARFRYGVIANARHRKISGIDPATMPILRACAPGARRPATSVRGASRSRRLLRLGGAAASWPTSDVADSILVISVWGGRWSSGDRGERTIMWPPRRWRRWCWSAAPSSNSSLDYHHDDARTAENGFAAKRSVNKSAKVVLVRMQLTLGRSEGGVPLGSALCGFDAGTFLNLNKIAHSTPMVDKWDNRAAVTIPTRIKRGLIVHHCALNKRDPNRSRGLPVSAGYLARETLILRRPNGCEDWSGQQHST